LLLVAVIAAAGACVARTTAGSFDDEDLEQRTPTSKAKLIL
jgi:hypothetical protein